MATGVTERNGKCFIRWYARGKRFSRSLDIPYTREGIARASRIRKAIIEQGEEETSPPTFGELAQQRLNTARMSPQYRKNAKFLLNRYAVQFFRWPVAEIKYADLMPLTNLNLKPGYIKGILAQISATLEIAIKSGWRTDNPAKMLAREVKKGRVDIDPFTAEERDRLLEELTGSRRLFYTIRFFTGMRPSEVIALTWDDYRDGEFKVTKAYVAGELRPTKTSVERSVPVHERIKAELKNVVRGIRNRHIVLNSNGDHFTTPQELSRSFNRARKKLGIRYRSPYNVRHTTASMMLSAGMKPGYCARILGHSTQMFFSTYARWIDNDENIKQAEMLMKIE